MRILSLVRKRAQQQRHLSAFPTAAASTALYLFVGSYYSTSSIQQVYSFGHSSVSVSTKTCLSQRWSPPWQQQQQQRFFWTRPLFKMSIPSTACTTTTTTSAASASSTSDNDTAENDDKIMIQKKRSDSICSNSSSSKNVSISDDDHLRIHLPCREYGYRTAPLDWDELTRIINVEQNLAKLSRSVKQQYEYEIYQRDLKTKWQSIMDHILCSKFNEAFQQVTNPDTGLYCAYPSLAEIKNVHKALVRNDFPYYLADNVEHWVLWKLGQDCTIQDVEQAKVEIQQQINVQDFLYYINPPHLKSLPEIDHVHILCKTIPKTTTTTTTTTTAAPTTQDQD